MQPMIVLTGLVLVLAGCGVQPAGGERQSAQAAPITEAEILAIQEAWGEGIVRIGQIYLEGGDSRNAAREHIETFYNYQEGPVLFKPTMAAQAPFRKDFAGALSYFIGGDENFPEDHGFALRPWRAVRWENSGIHIRSDMAVAMGNYFFSPADGAPEVKVEYSFAYARGDDGRLRILLHGSHLPYSPVPAHQD
jgi:hypothetical protein